jgi:hypothetical protein
MARAACQMVEQMAPDGCCLRGVITDDDLWLAEQEFPGITSFHAAHRGEHRTFLELMFAFINPSAT